MAARIGRPSQALNCDHRGDSGFTGSRCGVTKGKCEEQRKCRSTRGRPNLFTNERGNQKPMNCLGRADAKAKEDSLVIGL